jgi:hypothetical protein
MTTRSNVRSAGLFAIACACILAACGSSRATFVPTNGGASGTSATNASDDGGEAPNGADSDGGGSTVGGGGGGAAGDDGGVLASSDAAASCEASAGCGSLGGEVQRTSTAPSHGGKGPVYVAVFVGNPILDSKSATLIARTLLSNVDLSAAGAQVAYRIDGIPVSATPYDVVAFLDDANAVTPSNPTPASGDLVSLYSGGSTLSGYPVTIASTATASLNLPLNTAMP